MAQFIYRLRCQVCRTVTASVKTTKYLKVRQKIHASCKTCDEPTQVQQVIRRDCVKRGVIR